MRDYLIQFFEYNSQANLLMLKAIKGTERKKEALAIFSHIITSQQKWYYRVHNMDEVEFRWYQTAMGFEKCRVQWEISFSSWINYLSRIKTEELYRVVTYKDSIEGIFSSTVLDIAMQLNFHSVHHRAQIARIIREDGYEPPVTDFIYYTRKPFRTDTNEIEKP